MAVKREGMLHDFWKYERCDEFSTIPDTHTAPNNLRNTPLVTTVQQHTG